jgi:hypothetical protein
MEKFGTFNSFVSSTIDLYFTRLTSIVVEIFLRPKQKAPIDNSAVVCEHGKLNPLKISQVKRISPVCYNHLISFNVMTVSFVLCCNACIVISELFFEACLAVFS